VQRLRLLMHSQNEEIFLLVGNGGIDICGDLAPGNRNGGTGPIISSRDMPRSFDVIAR